MCCEVLGFPILLWGVKFSVLCFACGRGTVGPAPSYGRAVFLVDRWYPGVLFAYMSLPP